MSNDGGKMLWLLHLLRKDAGFQERKRSTAALKGRRKVYISRNDPAIKQGKHTVLNVIFRDWRRICERVVTEVFRQYAFGLIRFASLSLANAQLFKLQITYAALCPTVRELIWLRDAILLSKNLMSDRIFWIACQELVLLFSQ